MSSKQVLALQIAMNARIPTVIVGEPGCGKTATIVQLANAMSLPIEVVIASIRDPTDFGGLPIVPPDVREGGVLLEPPAWARNLHKAGRGVLFIDEISTAAPATQAALLRVTLDKCVGDLQLPDDVIILAAANPPECAAGGWDLSPPLANRFCHINWHLNAADWCEGMISGWGSLLGTIQTPMGIKPAILAQKNSIISSFIYHKQSALLDLPKEESATGKAWASPRTWSMGAKMLASCAMYGYKEDTEVAMMLLSGCVGDGPALEFCNWKEQVDLPDPEAVLKDPTSLKFPNKRGDIVFAILSSITAAIMDNNTVERWQQGWKVLSFAADQGFSDIGAMGARTLAKNRPKGSNMIPKEINKFEKVLRAAGVL
jgi:hypothetical protein